jgi:omega-amidase
MAQLSAAPAFKAFNLALIQLGGVTTNKADNLKHAREMVLKAASADGGSKPKPNLIVLPVEIH